MNIQPHIAQLLYRHQCVTVPGFGAFLTEIQSAQLIESSHSFFPPKKIISFNGQLQNNDGLLANHIAQSEKITYESAVHLIQYEVFLWKKTIQDTGLFSVKNVGDFTVNDEHHLIFTPNNQNNYLTNSFGLSAFVSPMVKRELFEQKIETVDEVPVLVLNPESNKRTSYLKYAALFVLGLGLTAAASYPIYQQHIANETLLVETAVQKQVQNKIQEATFFIENPIPAVTLTVKETHMPYHIVAGAFRDEKNAQKTVIQLSNQGFKARCIPQNKYGLYPVIYGSYSTFDQAAQDKKIIQKRFNPDAWILVESL